MKTLLFRTRALAHRRKNLLTEAGKYFLVGGVCTALDFALLFVLTHRGGVPPVPASVVSFLAGTLLNYYLCTLWIFKVRRVSSARLEMTYYLLITAVGLGLNSLVIWWLTAAFGYAVMLAKLAATFLTYWWNFGARKYFLHRTVAAQTKK